jgi:murein L,D-transpeptidase YafK
MSVFKGKVSIFRILGGVVFSCLFALILAKGFLFWRSHRGAPPPPKGLIKAEKVLVFKGERKLQLLKDGQPYKTYPISLGFNPKGHKEREGDGKTPEGSYRISGRNPQSSFHLSLKVSYPDRKDREKAAELGVSPGGDIFIHGLPNGDGAKPESYLGRDWTFGCISVDNSAIEYLWHAVADGTEIEIRF